MDTLDTTIFIPSVSTGGENKLIAGFSTLKVALGCLVSDLDALGWCDGARSPNDAATVYLCIAGAISLILGYELGEASSSVNAGNSESGLSAVNVG